jgi:hypothetical protein
MAFKICPKDTPLFGIWDFEFPGQAGTFLVPAGPGLWAGKEKYFFQLLKVDCGYNNGLSLSHIETIFV